MNDVVFTWTCSEDDIFDPTDAPGWHHHEFVFLDPETGGGADGYDDIRFDITKLSNGMFIVTNMETGEFCSSSPHYGLALEEARIRAVQHWHKGKPPKKIPEGFADAFGMDHESIEIEPIVIKRKQLCQCSCCKAERAPVIK